MPAHDGAVDERDLKMYRPPSGGDDQEITLGDVIERIRSGLPSGGRLSGGAATVVVLVVVVAVAIWAATGIYTVKPAELAALQLFGRFTGNLQGPGLHFFWPPPIGARRIEAVTETRRLELGFRSTEGGPVVNVPDEALMITGDLNIVDVQVIVQYRIKDLEQFLFRVDDPGDPDRGIQPGSPEGLTLKDAMEAALRQVVGQRSIDDILTVNKEAVQADTLKLLQAILDDYGTGIEILEVRLQNVRPPDEVRDAFDDVVRARVDKEARINEALAYQQDKLPKARGQAEKVLNSAKAFAQERQAKARGEAARFLSVLNEYKQSKNVTRQRLYLEAMEEILPGVKKYILTKDAAGGVLPFLPLGEGGAATAAAPGAGAGATGAGGGQ